MPRQRTAREQLRGLLKQRAQFRELRELQEQTRWVASVGSVDGLISWLEARQELGLLNDRHLKYSRCVVKACKRLITEHIRWQAPKPTPRRPWEEQMALINERESARRAALPPVGYRCTPKPKPKPRRRKPSPPAPNCQSMLERMAAAWKRLGRSS